ncbi:hypothetical protein CBR_g31376 [Chara braunii]|uniref:Reverse transcriptase RNase H-like domain-containing protein n=1 Tax=Chara braunii TaxID=69332 RepID=A0A388LET1_CHABU|nr:hypothetical protein CBR_g31376 [Chara braunii]|eukprot:GBG80820.1 hypothetical protein CBR_g31376 [Chara braunii]
MMPETGGASGAPKKGLTLDDLIATIDRHERNPSNIPKVNTFHFCGERVSEWLERVEQALVGRSDVVKFQRILQYVLHSYHLEVKKVIDAAQGSWERFKEGMQRKYHLGDGLLTTADLEAMNKEAFTTIGAFVQEFKKRARKVEQRQVRLQREKRKERDATASEIPGVKRIVTDVLAQLGYATEPVVQRRVVTVVQVKGKKSVVEEAVEEELWEEEEPVPLHLTKAQRKLRNLAQGGQGSGKGQAPQAQAAAPPNVAAPSSKRNYSQFKRETLAVLHCLRIFRNYIFSRRFILRVDLTALAHSLRNYVRSDPTVARWLTYIWMFNFELERILGSKNRADGLSRINWDNQEGEAVENTPPVDGFLDQEEDVRLHINKWSPRVPSCVGYPIWQAPNGYERRAELVLKPFEEEDPWGGKNVQWMMELALASSHSLVEDVRAIEEGPGQVERHEDLMGVMYLLVNTLLQESPDQSGSLNPTGNVDGVLESQDDEFEEGEIKEVFRAEEYDGIYLELGLLLSCEIRLRDASDGAQRMLQRYLVRDGHLFEEVPREEVPREEVPREEVQDTQREIGPGDEGRRAGKEVIEVAEDTPPQSPAVGLRLGDAYGGTCQTGEELQREEAPLPSSGKAPSPESRAERRRERAAVRREALTLIDRHLAAHALEHPDLQEPTPAEPRQEPCQPEKEMEAKIPKRVDLRTRERAPAGETAEEKRARRTRRIDEIWQERQRLEAAGELPEQQQERQKSEAAGSLPGQPPSAPARAPEIPVMWRDFWE